MGTSRATGWGQVVSLGGLRVPTGEPAGLKGKQSQTKSGRVDKGTDRLGPPGLPWAPLYGTLGSRCLGPQALLKDGGEGEWRVCFTNVRQSYHVLGSLLRALDVAQFLSLSTTNISGCALPQL